MDNLITRSMAEHTRLEMIYLADNQQISQRKLIVMEVNDKYIRAYCLLRKEVRTFKRENILAIMPEQYSKRRYLH
ncbi:WYL domain-containing protein [Neobacillus dielmonensis]|uniref:WYL domain-containing protein n=1 Tax=Neobacillus dielmonensis TaxID=1347369 RepID=UPI0005A72B13|nr:hypothetical protein [Neobacillus dielmonensis]